MVPNFVVLFRDLWALIWIAFLRITFQVTWAWGCMMIIKSTHWPRSQHADEHSNALVCMSVLQRCRPQELGNTGLLKCQRAFGRYGRIGERVRHANEHVLAAKAFRHQRRKPQEFDPCIRENTTMLNAWNIWPQWSSTHVENSRNCYARTFMRQRSRNLKLRNLSQWIS